MERTWSVMSAGVLRGRTNKTAVAMESSFPVSHGQRRALVTRMHGHAVYALHGGWPQPMALEPIGRDTTHALRTEELPKSLRPTLGTLLQNFDGGADGRTDTFMFHESTGTAVRYGGQFSALEGEVSARLVMERALRLTITFAADQTRSVSSPPLLMPAARAASPSSRRVAFRISWASATASAGAEPRGGLERLCGVRR